MTKADLLEMADERGEIAYTSNTAAILDKAVEEGLAQPIMGKFKMVEPGHMNSMYRVL